MQASGYAEQEHHLQMLALHTHRISCEPSFSRAQAEVD